MTNILNFGIERRVAWEGVDSLETCWSEGDGGVSGWRVCWYCELGGPGGVKISERHGGSTPVGIGIMGTVWDQHQLPALFLFCTYVLLFSVLGSEAVDWARSNA